MDGRGRLAGRAVHGLIALCASAALLALLAFGYGPVPALGRALDPGHGAWASAAGGLPVRSRTLALPGLAHPASVTFTSHGVPSIRAASQDDAFLALGYLHASFRLTEMDLERRLGEGRVAQLAGPSGLASDRFELRLGLLRTAQQEWAAMPRSSPAALALLAYSRGVNDYLAQVRADGHWPAIFGLTGVYPRDWTPVDSLVIQGVLTQELDFTTTPLDYALLERSLGPAHTMAWFPVLPPRGVPQSPYDPGPYRYRGIAPIAAQASAASVTAQPAATTAETASKRPGAGVPAGVAWPAEPRASRVSGKTTAVCAEDCQPAGAGTPGPATPAIPPTNPGIIRRSAIAAGSVLHEISALPVGLVHRYPDSNAWAANGRAVAGAAMLAGDPHLPQTLPSVWYQAALSAPGLAVTGVTVPGLPGVLIGHNAHIAWSLTDAQNQATLFYTEQTSPSRRGQYFWRGAWRPMRRVHYTIPVRGGGAVPLTVDLTVHGPVLTKAGLTTAVDWMGNIPSPDLAVLLAIDKAADFAQFRAALAAWRAPTQNFVYADDRGNIGAISAGYYPLVRHGDPWLPLPGTGADDVAGVIPYRAVPQVYDPPGHVVATANQRPVGPSYPYYLGTTADFFDPGYRAGQIYALLHGRSRMAPAAFAAIQLNVTDALARRIVPRLLAALHRRHLPATQQAAAGLLRGWDGSMTVSSAAAALWWTFWDDYLGAVFGPWWRAGKVPVHKDHAGLAVSAQQFSLDQVLEAWTVSDPHNAAFTPPGSPHRTAADVMRTAFAAAVAHLAARLGPSSAWAWGRLHTRQFPSITQAPGLGYGPRASGGDAWTIDAADGGLESHAGPSWRMIVDWTGHGSATAEGVYPGGQSENPASPWYTDQMADWWDGRYLPMPPAAGGAAGAVRWNLAPGGQGSGHG
jgi:penicillin G amidase